MYISRKDENSNWKRYILPSVHSSTIYNYQDMETTQQKCSSTDGQLKNTWYTIEYYSAIKKNEIVPFAAKSMDLENIILSEVNQTNII